MSGRAARWAIAALLLTGSAAGAQTHPNLDFEEGLRGWTRAGTAFADEPIDGSAVDPARFPASPIGGDYWNVVPYPLGHHGRWFVSSDDAGIGTLISDEFVLSGDDRYFSALIGGSGPSPTPRIELHVEGDGALAAVWRATIPGIDLLQQRVFALPPALAGRRARIVIVDDAPDAHVSVDHVRLTAQPPQPHDGPVWGVADYHTHPTAYLGFGGLRGVRALWGRPGSTASAYARDPSLFELDLPECPDDHGGGATAGIFINTVEKRLLPRDVKPRGFTGAVRALVTLLTGGFTRHGDDGAPGFEDHPTFLSGAHQQMHVTQIHRAWHGGLRLMVALGVHNEGVEYLVSSGGDAPGSSDREVLEAQVCGMRRLAALNADWMAIAYTAREARDIIRSGRLAIVLGAEFDRLGDLEGFTSLENEAQYLWNLGIRQVTPIHAVDNRLGGAAVFEPAYNSLNDLLKRGARDLAPSELDAWAPAFFDVREGCPTESAGSTRGECVRFRLSPAQDRAVRSRTIFSPFRATATLHAVDVPHYREHAGHTNTRGLTPDGRAYLSALMSRGMLIGLEHMSQRSVEDLEAMLGGRDYPLLSSHTHFRALAIQDRRRTSAEGFLPDEFDAGERTVDLVRRTGGVAGVFTYANPLDPHPLVQAPFEADCAASSKGFGYAFLYGLGRLGGAGLATDFTFVPAMGPRFGEHACWGLKAHWDAREGGPLREQYRPERQDHGVRYAGFEPAPGVRVGSNAPLTPYTMGERRFDFNVDGLAHYGMLPDLLQDLRNLGFGAREFGALFSSAEAYLQMWEKAERLATDHTARSTFTPAPLACDVICRGLCP